MLKSKVCQIYQNFDNENQTEVNLETPKINPLLICAYVIHLKAILSSSNLA